MNRVVVFEREDGQITIRRLHGRRLPGESDDAYADRLAAQRPRGKRLPDCDPRTLPSLVYRDAWRADRNGRLYVDETEKQRIEAERARPTLEQRIAKLEAKIKVMEKK